MDHSPEEEWDCGNKPGEANLAAVNRGPLVHQPFSTNDGGGELQYQLLIKRFKINKVASESRSGADYTDIFLRHLQSTLRICLFLQNKWG